jgi:transposase
VAFYEVTVSMDVNKLDDFICKYHNDATEAIATFASGLKKDYDAVKNGLIYPQISNGPIEGTNNKIKMIRRRGYGRAGIELINAIAVLPWYYKDIDENCKLQNTSVA